MLYPALRRLVVIELLEPVIAWHRSRLVPLAAAPIEDPRCTLVAADFFDYVKTIDPARQYDAIMLDIDHAPDCWLHPKHRQFYGSSGKWIGGRKKPLLKEKGDSFRNRLHELKRVKV